MSRHCTSPRARSAPLRTTAPRCKVCTCSRPRPRRTFPAGTQTAPQRPRDSTRRRRTRRRTRGLCDASTRSRNSPPHNCRCTRSWWRLRARTGPARKGRRWTRRTPCSPPAPSEKPCRSTKLPRRSCRHPHRKGRWARCPRPSSRSLQGRGRSHSTRWTGTTSRAGTAGTSSRQQDCTCPRRTASAAPSSMST